MSVRLIITFVDLLGLSMLAHVLALVNPTSEPPLWAKELHASREQSGDRRPPVIDRRYAGQFAQLEASGLVLPVTRGVAWFYSGYFCVMKTLEYARAIFNGRRLSALSPTPEPVNLVDTQRLVESIHAFLADQPEETRDIHVYGGDFRHWFHQIPIPEWMQNLFGLRVQQPTHGSAKGTTIADYVWRALPMGWSWSPVIAQSIAWGYLLYRDPDSKEVSFFDEDAFRGNRLPTWIDIIHPTTKRRCGRATVYYDNFLIICDDGNLLERIRNRLENNCTRLGVLIKEGSEIKRDKATFCKHGFDYLGVHFQGIKQKKRDHDHHVPRSGLIVGMTWGPTKTEEWTTTAGPACNRIERQEPITLREAATVAGQVIFALLMAPGGLRRHADAPAVLEASRDIGLLAHHSGDWDSNVPAERRWLRPLRDAWFRATATTEPGHAYRSTFGELEGPRAATYESIIATDASKSGLGWVGLSPHVNAMPHECRGRNCTADEAEKDIFILEMMAALEGLSWWCREHPGEERVCLVVDNSGAAFALRNGFSSNSVATGLMQETSNAANLRRVEDVILVISEDNPADCCSRCTDQQRITCCIDTSHATFERRVSSLWKCVEARKRGWSWASEKRAIFDQRLPEGRPQHDPVDLPAEAPAHGAMHVDGADFASSE